MTGRVGDNEYWNTACSRPMAGGSKHILQVCIEGSMNYCFRLIIFKAIKLIEFNISKKKIYILLSTIMEISFCHNDHKCK